MSVGVARALDRPHRSVEAFGLKSMFQVTPSPHCTQPASLAKPHRFPPRLGNGASQLPWLPPLAAVAVLVSLGATDCIPEVFNWMLIREWHAGNFIWPTLIGMIPVIGCLAYLTRRAGTTIGNLFGLRGARLRGVLLWGGVLFVLELLLSVATGVLLSSVGLDGGFEKASQRSKAGVLSFYVLADEIVWAPFFEELAYRGLLYAALRTRFGVTSSAVVTAALFAFTHPLDSFDQTLLFAPAVLSSLWYERTRSLWPNVVSHAMTNLLANMLS